MPLAALVPSKEVAPPSLELSTGPSLVTLAPFPEGVGLALASLANAEFKVTLVVTWVKAGPRGPCWKREIERLGMRPQGPGESRRHGNSN